MGKKKKGAVCNNPVAMARAAGPAPVSGPTIKDYLNRDRPSLEEAAGLIAAQHRKKECGSLAAYEEQMNDDYRKELKKRREMLLGTSSDKPSHRSRSREKKDKKKKKKHKKEKKARKEKRNRSRSRSRSPPPTSSSDEDEDLHISQKHHRSLLLSSSMKKTTPQTQDMKKTTPQTQDMKKPAPQTQGSVATSPEKGANCQTTPSS